MYLWILSDLGAIWEPTSAQNPIWEPSWEPKSAQIGHNLAPGRPQDGPSWPQESLKRSQVGPEAAQDDMEHPWGQIFPVWRRRRRPTWSPKSTKIGPKMDPKIDIIFDPFLNRFWVAKWTKKLTQN